MSAYVAWLRSLWFDRISEGDDIGTAAAVKFARNWHAKGAWALRFAMLENPASIKFGKLEFAIPTPDIRREPFSPFMRRAD